ncbi:MAG: hypothetical protein HYY34_06945 [Chloroflexi bacterium]|nr:hypothetical protein [Chloroflexota bacterium]
MGIVIGVLLAVGAVAVIAWPFFRRRSDVAKDDIAGGPGARPQGSQAELQRSRAEIFRLIRQLEADHGSGLVNEGDFRSQFDDLRREAARLMMEEAALSPMSDPAAELEREIAAARAGLTGRPVETGRKDA